MIQSEWANEWIHGNISTLRVITPEPRGVQLVSVMVRLLNWFEYHRRETSLKWSWEARRGALTEETTLHLWKEVTLLVAGGGFYPCLAMAQPIKATVLWSSNLFQWTVFNSSSQLPLLCKRGSPPLPQHTCTWFIVVAGPKLQFFAAPE